ncbi:MAG: HyaD/HybD family hydrogenase maturation endopeptidase [Pseudomonadota bacterium]
MSNTAARQGVEALVLGVGNVLWADEGFGVRCAEEFCAQYSVPDSVEVMDGGTQGLALINDLAAAKRILIFDAVDAKLPPGTLTCVRGADVPRFVAGKKVSLHQSSMMEILALAELMADSEPEKITLIGCQPVDMEDYGGGLTPQAAARVPEAVRMAAMELQQWGLGPALAQGPADPIMPASILRDVYENGRPSEQVACRIGDDRILAHVAAGAD